MKNYKSEGFGTIIKETDIFKARPNMISKNYGNADVYYKGMTKAEMDFHDILIEGYSQLMSTVFLDILEGMTDGLLSGFSYGHKDKEGNENYWYKNNKVTGMQQTEMWAHFYAAQMTEDSDTLKLLWEFFPLSYRYMEMMMKYH